MPFVIPHFENCRSTHARRAWIGVMLGCFVIAQGCYRYTERVPDRDSYVRIQFDAPRDLSAGSSETDRVVLPAVIQLEGEISRVEGDTLRLNLWRALDADTSEVPIKAGATTTTVIADSGVVVETRAIDAKVTMLVSAFVVLGFVAVRLPTLPSQ